MLTNLCLVREVTSSLTTAPWPSLGVCVCQDLDLELILSGRSLLLPQRADAVQCGRNCPWTRLVSVLQTRRCVKQLLKVKPCVYGGNVLMEGEKRHNLQRRRRPPPSGQRHQHGHCRRMQRGNMKPRQRRRRQTQQPRHMLPVCVDS